MRGLAKPVARVPVVVVEVIVAEVVVVKYTSVDPTVNKRTRSSCL